GASGTKVALAPALLAMTFVVADLGMENPDRLPAPHLHRPVIAHQVDGEAATARGLAADRAVAELIGIRRVTCDTEVNRAAAARTFKRESHGHLPGRDGWSTAGRDECSLSGSAPSCYGLTNRSRQNHAN